MKTDLINLVYMTLSKILQLPLAHQFGPVRHLGSLTEVSYWLAFFQPIEDRTN